LDACAGPGYFTVGDAATVQDPSSSHGVLRAIMSGLLAGRMAAGQRYSDRSNIGVAEYRHFTGSWFQSDCERARDLGLIRRLTF
jgi:flavin-dependent dehydrogenase